MGGDSTTPIPLFYHWTCLVAHTDSTVTLAACTSPPQAQARHNLNMQRGVGSMFTCIFELKMLSLVPAYQPGHGSSSWRAGSLHWSSYLALGHCVHCVIVAVNVQWYFHASLGFFHTLLPFASQVAMETSLPAYRTLISLAQYFKIVSGVRIYPWISKLFIDKGVKCWSTLTPELWLLLVLCVVQKLLKVGPLHRYK